MSCGLSEPCLHSTKLPPIKHTVAFRSAAAFTYNNNNLGSDPRATHPSSPLGVCTQLDLDLTL